MILNILSKCRNSHSMLVSTYQVIREVSEELVGHASKGGGEKVRGVGFADLAIFIHNKSIQ